jgi:hypothetical protein
MGFLNIASFLKLLQFKDILGLHTIANIHVNEKDRKEYKQEDRFIQIELTLIKKN